MALTDKLALFAARHATRELRRTNDILESLTDTIRLVNGLDPIYSKRDVPAPIVPSIPDPDAFIRAGDYLTQWLIEELAQEHFVPMDDTTNYERLAVERGWVKSGEFVMLPATAQAAGLTLDMANGKGM